MSPHREAGVAAGGAVAVAAAANYPALLHPASTIPADLGDPLLEAYTLGWGGHALVHQPLHPFDANIFFPLPNSLAFTDSLLGYAPVSWLGSGPTAALVRYNLIFVAAVALCAWGAYLLVRQLGIPPAAACVAGAVFAFAPWRGGQAGHLQILSCGGVPLALALLARGHGVGWRGAPRVPRPRCALLGWIVAAWQVTLGFGVGLQWSYLLALLCLVAVGHAARGGRPLPKGRLLLADATGATCFAVVGVAFALPYLTAVHDHPEARRTVADLALFSPPPRGFLIPPAVNVAWGGVLSGARDSLAFPPEMTLGLGGTAVVLAVLGVVRGRWRLRLRLLLLASLLVLLLFALGTHGPFGGRLTYLELFHHAPGFAGIRTPGRLVVCATVPLALLAAAGAEVVAGAAARWRAAPAVVAGALALLVVLEGVNALDHPSPAAEPSTALRTGVGPLLVLPSDAGADDTIEWWSTDGFPALVNGSSGFDPALTSRLRTAAADFPAEGAGELRAAGVRRVLVLLDSVDSTTRERALGPLPAGVTRTLLPGAAMLFLTGNDGG